MEWIVPLLFAFSLAFNLRAAWKLFLDWRGMVITTRFVREAYARLHALPTEEALEREDRAPVFLHLIAAYQEPGIAKTLKTLLGSRYPHGKVRFVVVTKEEEERAPHPAMGVSTGELIRRFQADLPPWKAKLLWHLTMPGPGRKAHQLNWALRPEVLSQVLEDPAYDPARIFVGVSDADSLPDENVYRWIAGEELAGRGALAYQGITLSLANWTALNLRERISAIQQSSIFVRVSIARLINEPKRVRAIEAILRRLPWAARWLRPCLEVCLRRSHICLGHNQFVRLDTLEALGGFPTQGATEDSTLGYDLGMRGILIRAMPMVELNDLPESKEKIIQQNARWYKGVLDDTGHLRRAWRRDPNAFNLAQLIRHAVNKVVEWPVAAVVYPLMGFLGWHFAFFYEYTHPWLYGLAIGVPTVSLFLTVWVGGIVTQRSVQAMEPYLPSRIPLAWRSRYEWFMATFRCQTYWLLATRGSWRVLWRLLRDGHYLPAKTDRAIPVSRSAGWRAMVLQRLWGREAGLDKPRRLG